MSMIGFIGLGRMGRPMASNLCRKGFRLIVHDINPAPVRELELLQARAAGSVAEVAAASDIVVTMLPELGRASSRWSAGADGVIWRMRRAAALVMDMSTVDPRSTDRIAAAARRRGFAFVDAPVGRLASHADRGESLFMVGAADGDFERVKPLLEAMGTTIHHCGDVGTGTRTKLVNNYLAIVLLPAQCRGAGAVAALRPVAREDSRGALRHDGLQRPAQDRLADRRCWQAIPSRASPSISRIRI